MIHDPDAQAELARGIADGEARHQANGCLKRPLVATLTGTAMISTDHAKLKGPFSKDISLELVFSGDRTQVELGSVDISTESGVRAVSDGGIGKFYHSSGLMEIPFRVRVGKKRITLNLNFTLSTESTEMRGLFASRGTRLQADGSITLAGAAFDSVFGMGVAVLLVISGTLQPHP